MEKHPIAAIVNFCSNERRFIKSCLEQCQIFSRQVIVSVCDHFFDGTAENRALLEEIYGAFPGCLFVEYPYIPEAIPKRIWKMIDPAHFWHSLSRLAGFSFLDDDIEAVLFLDADEVPDGKRFAEWLDCSDYHGHMTLKMANYWYFREPQYQALRWEDSVVLAQRRAINPDLLLRREERDAIYDLLPGPKRRHVIGINGEPMFHHYSWVRTPEEMLKKVCAWGHRGDKNWVDLVQKEFSGPFRGTDFIHGYNYKTVEALFDIRLDEPRFEKKGNGVVKRMEEKELLELIQWKKSPFWEWFSQTFLFTR
ncbi:MAG TPA: hypothetical protein VLE89_09090 [Chlamydiales bacterium]|nr:hypothetical protein [Chlamydiales bacterium]